ncbi:cytochrome bc1 complex Rieske iron-sulfur subunit [Streptacidiphilus albus]|uniref:cytochrome bc1 complex Rieske iron-sulfur subunit n=1 Tax=Streptacidiphilus albus TaxID=105425 RepID=UPI00054B5CB1|nr:Rieske 2Fe-2S domain-containing protein [Streptacidiphilus albus]
MTSQDNMSEEHLPEAVGPHGGAVAVHDDPFADPGLPPHEPRRTDIDERAAARAERQVARWFILSMIATVGFIASYVAIKPSNGDGTTGVIYIFTLGHISALNFALGTTLGISLFGIGAGAVHWARTLMSDEEHIAERHPIESTPEVRAQVFADFRQGAAESGFGRRKLIRNTMIGAMAMLPLSAIVLFRDLGPLPEKKLDTTDWSAGKQLINMNTNEPLQPSDITVGSLTFAMPPGLNPDDPNADPTFQEVIATSALLLVRMEPSDIKDAKSASWGYDGILAFSKICTHVGCPISLYEQQTHHVLCPCHQSTFDLSDGGRVIFGPAGHPLPQLQITVNADGNLAAVRDFTQPVGPGFWERS